MVPCSHYRRLLDDGGYHGCRVTCSLWSTAVKCTGETSLFEEPFALTIGDLSGICATVRLRTLCDAAHDRSDIHAARELSVRPANRELSCPQRSIPE